MMQARWSHIQTYPRQALAWYRRQKRWLRRSLEAGLGVGCLFGLFLLLDLLFPLPAPKPFSQTIYAQDSSLLCAYLSPDDKWRLETRPGDVHPEMIEAIVAKEDRWFYHHPGINPFSLLRALGTNLLAGRRVSGASTLTMQVARMAEPSARTYGAKLAEMFRALQYEWHHSKEEILRLYLSYLPYGGNIEGVAAASYLYFDRPPARLSLSQSILLAVIPNRPNSLRLDAHAPAARAARDKWIERFAAEGTFPAADLAAAQGETVPTRRLALPPETPHFCLELRRQQPRETRLYSSLDLRVQRLAERLLRAHTQRVRPLGVSTGAVLVLDNATAEVLAYCGSADFYDEAADGQVDGVQAVRSPGSTLKSFAYAQAFGQGRLTPGMKLLDVPTDFRSFTPENYDGEFRGEVSAYFALAHSLNIPPVRLVQDLGLKSFVDLLEQAGFETVAAQREDLGLSVVLGGCGVTLAELTRAYQAFASEGELRPLAYRRQDSSAQGRSLLTPGAAWLVGRILSDLERPDLPQRYLDDTQRPRVAWKTGTSYGRRDAWSIGFTPRYTIGVWMGNFDGRGVPEMSGSSMAVPLLLDMFNALETGQAKPWFAPPPSVLERQVCQHSGLLPGPHCTGFKVDWYLETASSLRSCDRHRGVYVAADSSESYCPHCLPDSGYQTLVYPDYEPELLLWSRAEGRDLPTPPPHHAACEARYSDAGPQNLSPSVDYGYFLTQDGEEEVLLQAASGPGVSRHYWYVNGTLFATVDPGEKAFFRPPPGELEVICMDEKGRKSRVAVEVTYY